MRRILIPTALLMVTTHAHALGLRAIATEAVHHDPRMAASTEQMKAAEAGVALARSNDGLNVSLAADAGLSNLQTDAPFPASGSRKPNSASLVASLPVFSSGRTSALEASAHKAVDAALERRRDLGGKLILATLTATMDTKRERETLRLTQATLQTLQAAREDIGKRYAAGEATRTDLSQADARVAEAHANVVRAQTQMRATELELLRYLGRVPTDLDIDWPRQLPLPASREEAVRLSQFAPAVVASRHTSDAAREQIRSSLAEGLPQISIDARASTQDDTEFGYERLSTWGVLLKLQVPLYTGGRVPARVAEARAKAAASDYLAMDEAAFFAQTAASEWELLQASEQVIEAVRAQQTAAELALDGVAKELKVGSRTTLDLLDAQRELLSAQVNLVGAEHDRAVTAFRLLAACGILELHNLPE